jgi:hypothetical protein
MESFCDMEVEEEKMEIRRQRQEEWLEHRRYIAMHWTI